MLKEERQNKILEILNSEQRVISSDLKNRLNVSEDTIRRDLKELDDKKLLKRVHSGALRIGPPVQDFIVRQELKSDIKDMLAKKALKLIKPGDVVLIDGGTTNLAFISNIPLDFYCTIITNSPPVVMALSKHENIEVIVLGGTLYKESMVNLGIDTIQALTNMRANVYIMGIYNIDLDEGTSVPTLSEALVKRKMVEISANIVAIVTADKLGTVSNQIVSSVSDITYLVTEEIPNTVKNSYSSKKITVI